MCPTRGYGKSEYPFQFSQCREEIEETDPGPHSEQSSLTGFVREETDQVEVVP